jgi:predicted metal-binding membrane protein
MTRPVATATATLALAAVAWVVALGRMGGMDMGGATELGSLGSFAAVWIPMMAAMMLPAAAPGAVRAGGAPRFLAAYLAVWIVLGVLVYVVYAPHGALTTGLVTVAAGLYELTPLKRRSRARCRAEARSGLRLGLHCLGSSLGLMAMFVALGVMNIAWMAVLTVVVLAQELLPPRAAIDVPVALAIVALGLSIAL